MSLTVTVSGKCPHCSGDIAATCSPPSEAPPHIPVKRKKRPKKDMGASTSENGATGMLNAQKRKSPPAAKKSPPHKRHKSYKYVGHKAANTNAADPAERPPVKTKKRIAPTRIGDNLYLQSTE